MAVLERPRLDDLVALALEAGREILKLRADGCEVIGKADGSPVTRADARAEEIIEAGLARLSPHIPMLGEEASAEGRKPDLGVGEKAFFCVDPLDGTRDFLEPSSVSFTVNISLIETGAPIMGVVYAPALGEMYFGESGGVGAPIAFKQKFEPAKKRAQGPAQPLSTISTKQPLRVIVSHRSGANAQTENFLQALGAFEKVSESSSLKFGRLAEGASDLYPRFGPINWWDVAAGHAVLAAAGGGVMRLDGSELAYTGQSTLLDGLIAYACADAAAAARTALTHLAAR